MLSETFSIADLRSKPPRPSSLFLSLSLSPLAGGLHGSPDDLPDVGDACLSAGEDCVEQLARSNSAQTTGRTRDMPVHSMVTPSPSPGPTAPAASGPASVQAVRRAVAPAAARSPRC